MHLVIQKPWEIDSPPDVKVEELVLPAVTTCKPNTLKCIISNNKNMGSPMEVQYLSCHSARVFGAPKTWR